MQRPRTPVLIAAGLAAFAIAGAVLAYSVFRRGGVADASPAPELLSEVPAGAPTLIYADLAAIRASTFYQQRPDHGPIAIPDRDYADFVQSTGFDFEKDLDRVVIASWPAGLSQGQDKQDRKKPLWWPTDVSTARRFVITRCARGKLDRQEGREVFLFPTDNQPGLPAGQAGWNSITFLDDHRVAIVEGPSIAPLLARHDDGAAADPARARAARVAGAAVFAISRVPAIPDNFLPAESSPRSY